MSNFIICVLFLYIVLLNFFKEALPPLPPLRKRPASVVGYMQRSIHRNVGGECMSQWKKGDWKKWRRGSLCKHRTWDTCTQVGCWSLFLTASFKKQKTKKHEDTFDKNNCIHCYIITCLLMNLCIEKMCLFLFGLRMLKHTWCKCTMM